MSNLCMDMDTRAKPVINDAAQFPEQTSTVDLRARMTVPQWARKSGNVTDIFHDKYMHGEAFVMFVNTKEITHTHIRRRITTMRTGYTWQSFIVMIEWEACPRNVKNKYCTVNISL